MIQFTSITKREDGAWVFAWADTLADYYRILFNGIEIATVDTPEWVCDILSGTLYPPLIEVVSEEEVGLTESNRCFLRFQWYSTPGAKAYRIDQWDGSNWIRKAFIIDNIQTAIWSWGWDSAILSDATHYQFRIVSVDDVGQESDPLDFDISVACPPAWVESDTEILYDQGTGSVVIQGA